MDVMREGRAPVRTCIGCRRRGPAVAMVRLRIVDGSLVIGPGPGRGASIHPTPACVEAACRPGVLGRAFKRAVGVPGDFLTRLISGPSVAPSPDGHL